VKAMLATAAAVLSGGVALGGYNWRYCGPWGVARF